MKKLLIVLLLSALMLTACGREPERETTGREVTETTRQTGETLPGEDTQPEAQRTPDPSAPEDTAPSRETVGETEPEETGTAVTEPPEDTAPKKQNGIVLPDDIWEN